MTRAEHVRWAKDRANAYLRQGEIVDAITSMMCDLEKHPETKAMLNGPLGSLGMMYAMSGDADGAERYINGFAE